MSTSRATGRAAWRWHGGAIAAARSFAEVLTGSRRVVHAAPIVVGGRRIVRVVDDDGLDLSAQLFELARAGGTDELLAFLDSGLPVDLTDANGESLLMLAVSHQRVELVRALLWRGADPSLANHAGETPRSRAARLKLTGIEVVIDDELRRRPDEDPAAEDDAENGEAPGPGGDLGPGAPG